MATCQECGAVTATGCLCSVTDSDCIAVNGDGDATPFSFDPTLDPDVANLLVCTPGAGLGAFLPPEIENPPACRVYSSVGQNILTGTDTSITFNQERFDTDTMHDNATNNTRITFTTAGVYVVTFSMTWEANNVGDRKIRVRHNGSVVIASDERSSDQADDFDHAIGTVYKFAAADYIEAYVTQNSGTTVQSLANGNYAPEFAAVRIAAG